MPQGPAVQCTLVTIPVSGFGTRAAWIYSSVHNTLYLGLHSRAPWGVPFSGASLLGGQGT